MRIGSILRDCAAEVFLCLMIASKFLAKSKRFLAYVMFLAAVAHRHYDGHVNSYFDFKIGLWPFIELRAAEWSSANNLERKF